MIDCTEYDNCPKNLTDSLVLDTVNRHVKLLFVGCWGTYCKNQLVTVGKYKKKEWKETNVYYGERLVSDSIKNISKKSRYNALILGGDNVYSIPVDLMEDSDVNLYKENHKSVYDMDKQLSIGFETCINEVSVDNFLVGVGNHDIESCDVLNKQLNYQGWTMPSLSYNVIYNITGSNKTVNIIFIDTNMYSENLCNGKEYPDDAKLDQEQWLADLLNKGHTWNIVVGHIPFIANNHKQNGKDRYEKDLYNLLKKYNKLIHLYMCADEHNQQYITIPGMPPQVIAGSGGASQDTDIYILESGELGKHTNLARSTFGFVSLVISPVKIFIAFHGIAELDKLDEPFKNDPEIVSFTIKHTN